MKGSGRVVSINDVIDSRPLSWFQVRTYIICVLVGALDGFDSQAIAFTAPFMAGDLGIDIRSFGPIFAAGNIGGMIGALTLPMIADRVGRRSMIIASVVLFAFLTLVNAFAGSYEALLAIRFLCGLGIGAALPSVIALATEYAPRARRSLLVTIVTSGFPAGAMVAGAVTSFMVPHLGWQSVYYIGAAAPLVLAAFLIVYLPESIRFLVGTDAPLERVAAQIRLIAKDLVIAPSDRFFLPEAKFKGLPVKHLFTDGRAGMTLLIWFIYFLNLYLLFYLYNWMPPVLEAAGLPRGSALLATALFNLGGVVGGIALGLLADKIGAFPVLVSAYGLGALSLGAVGFLGSSAPLVMATLLFAGVCCIGAQTTANPLTASLYPTLARGTGLGWAFGVARVGTIFGPLVGGILISAGWGERGIFLAAVVPPVAAGLAILALKGVVTRAEARTPAPSVPASPRAAAPAAAPPTPLPRGAILGLEAVEFAVEDVANCIAFHDDIGLEKRESGRTGATFSVPSEGTRIVLREEHDRSLPPPIQPGESLRRIVWGVSDREALDQIGRELSRDRDVLDVGGVLHTTGPNGLALAFQVTSAHHARTALVTPGVSRLNSRIAAYKRPVPSHLGHLGLFTPDFEADARFYQRLGFRISDRITEFGLFLRGTGSIDHHNLFLIKRERPGLNHLNLRLADVDELGTGIAFLERRGWRPVWGIGRHLFGSHMFGFFDNPAGSYLEFTCDEDYILDDNAWQPVDLDPRTTPITMWGGVLPEEVFKGEKPRAPSR